VTTQADPILAYADQNFVSTCADDSARTETLANLRNQSTVRLVLSPWHLYEIGKASAERIDRMVRFLEAVEPLWIPPRLDLQTFEFAAAWMLFWGHRQTLDFNPIGSLNDVVASMGSPARPTGDLRAAIAEFESNAARKYMEDGLEPHRPIAAQNRADFAQGRFDRGLRYTTDLQCAALHMARLGGVHLDDPRPEQVRVGLLNNARTSVEIDFFLDFGGRTD
jgi:hypothetical protein